MTCVRAPLWGRAMPLWRGSLLPLGCATDATVAALEHLQWLGKTGAAAPPSGSKLPRHKRSMVFQSGSSPALCRHPLHGRSPMSWASKLPRHKRSMAFQSGSSPALCRHPMHGRSPMSWASELLWRGRLLPLGCAADAIVAGLEHLQWLGKTGRLRHPAGASSLATTLPA